MEGIQKFRKITVALSLVLVFGLTSVVFAADFNLSPSSGTLGINQDIEVRLRIDTAGESINAAQATMLFPANLLQVKSISKEGSIFNFWLQDPTFSNDAGTISFIGGTPSGVSGSSLQVITIIFTTKGVGSAAISFSDGAITAADGTGTNVLGALNGAIFSVSSTVSVPPPTPAAPVAPITIATPVPIVREAISAPGLPSTPVISVPLYPDPDRWYSLISNFTTNWQLPSDVSGVATALNQNPSYTVPGESEGLFNSKQFPSFQEDGINYLHVRFKNNKGWGATAHYRIAIDTQPPLAFTIQIEGGPSTDNPRPKLLFQTGDALSGIDTYLVQINQDQPISVSPMLTGEETEEVEEEIAMIMISDGGISFLNVRAGPGTGNDIVTKVFPREEYEVTDSQSGWFKILLNGGTEGWVFGDYVTQTSGDGQQRVTLETAFISEYELPPLLPGQYLVKIRAVDKAGNGVENSIELEVLPIDSPTIDFYTERVIQKLEVVNVRGSAIPNTEVIITMLDEEDILVLENTVPVNELGIWNFTLERILRKETYSITAKTRDERGAISFPTDPIKIKVADKPLIVIGNIEFSLKNLVFIGIALLIAVAVFFWRDTIKRALSLQRKSVIAAKDLRNLVDGLKEGAISLQTEMRKTRMNRAQASNALNKVVKKLNQIDRYVIKDIEEINE